jgi:hypothetical protein
MMACHHFGAKNFEMAPGFLENLFALAPNRVVEYVICGK